jgi:hypothetical protein
MPRCSFGDYCAVASNAAIAGIFGLLFAQHGTDLWMLSPNPVFAFLMIAFLGVVLPCSSVALLIMGPPRYSRT